MKIKLDPLVELGCLKKTETGEFLINAFTMANISLEMKRGDDNQFNIGFEKAVNQLLRAGKLKIV